VVLTELEYRSKFPPMSTSKVLGNLGLPKPTILKILKNEVQNREKRARERSRIVGIEVEGEVS